MSRGLRRAGTFRTEPEKLEIARNYLAPRQLDQNRLTADLCQIDDDALTTIIRDDMRETGCRGLERQIGAVFRAIAVRIAGGTVAPARI